MDNGNEKNKNTAAIWAFWGAVVAALITAIVTLIVADKIPFFTATSTPDTNTPFVTTTSIPNENSPDEKITFLSELSPRIVEAAGGNYCIGRDPVGDPPSCIGEEIKVKGTPYPHSLFAHADSVLVFDLNGQYDTFVTSIVLQGGDCGDGASFRIELDGKEVFKSSVIQHGEIPRDLRINVKNMYVLRLETYVGGNNDYFCDGTIWGEPYLISKP